MSIAVAWVVFGVVCALAEAVLPLMTPIFFALGAWAAAAASALGCGLEQQIGVFIAVSILSLLLLRRHATAFFSGKSETAGGEAAHPLIGRIGTVSRAVSSSALGEIDVGGSFWRAASSSPINAGEQARVLAALPDDGLTLRVEALRSQDNPQNKEQL